MARAASANAEEFLTSSEKKQVKITHIDFFFKWKITNCAYDRKKVYFFSLTLQGQRVMY